jgi:hypothetical protein
VREWKNERDEILASVVDLSNHITSDAASKNLKRFLETIALSLCCGNSTDLC